MDGRLLLPEVVRAARAKSPVAEHARQSVEHTRRVALMG